MYREFDVSLLRDLPREKPWLVGVSGGADSVALLHLLIRAQFRNLTVCHLDHQLRGKASEADARFVRSLAKNLGCRYMIGRRNVYEMMTSSRISLETAARVARHEFFSSCARRFKSNNIILAHHADDQAETVIWNLLRGSYGLKGMSFKQRFCVHNYDINIYRPLLCCRRPDLANWLQHRHLPWRYDESNSMPIAIRNRLRHEVIPLLGKVSGRDPVMMLIRGAIDSAERDKLELELVRNAGLLDPHGRLHLPSLRGLPPVLQRRAISEYLKANQVLKLDRSLLDRALELVASDVGLTLNLHGGRQLKKRAGRIFIQ